MTRRRRPPRWVPNQHGAWAMLAVPYLLGAILRLRSGEPAWFLVPLFVCWLAGYVAFYNASGWLKAPARRRPAWVRPTLVAGGVAVASGLATLAAVAPAWWVLFFAVTTVRAAVIPRLAEPLHVARIGFIELGLSSALIVAFVLA